MMKLDKIMIKIGMGLTGIPSRDIPYLQDVMEKYKEHKYSEEILEACASLIFEVLPEDKQRKLEEVCNKRRLGVEAGLEKVKVTLLLGEFEEVKELLEGLIDKIEKATCYEESENIEYHSFNEPMEVAIYKNIYKPKKQVDDVGENFAKVYFIYADILASSGKKEAARKLYKKALFWNPVDADVILAEAETYRTKCDLKKFYETTKKAFKVSYKQEQLAKCYTNFGDYFQLEKLWETAKGCYVLALQAYNNKAANKGLKKINRITNDSIKEPTISMLRADSKRYELPLGANEDIIKIAFRYGKQFMEKKEFGLARYFLEISYELTKNEKLKLLLEEMSDDSM